MNNLDKQQVTDLTHENIVSGLEKHIHDNKPMHERAGYALGYLTWALWVVILAWIAFLRLLTVFVDILY